MHITRNLLYINKFSSSMIYSLTSLLNSLIFKYSLMTFNNSSSMSYLLTLLLDLMIFFYFNLFIKKVSLLSSIIESVFFKAVYLSLFKNQVVC